MLCLERLFRQRGVTCPYCSSVPFEPLARARLPSPRSRQGFHSRSRSLAIITLPVALPIALSRFRALSFSLSRSPPRRTFRSHRNLSPIHSIRASQRSYSPSRTTTHTSRRRSRSRFTSVSTYRSFHSSSHYRTYRRRSPSPPPFHRRSPSPFRHASSSHRHTSSHLNASFLAVVLAHPRLLSVATTGIKKTKARKKNN